jgi:hypothetical protein
MGIVSGIGILCWAPGKAVLAWFGFLSGIASDSITAHSIFKWLSQITKNAVDSMINPFSPNSLQVRPEHINVSIGLCIFVLIALSFPAFSLKDN